ncbi:MAG: hypothetical protein ACP5PX_04650 [Candidatus Hadarchaeum sp.]|uniref:hypothetical protein n=1 Tax=Candidatus Hadarchaeum sp. TaxID=2883567 RepID=UPI003D139587
MRKIDARPIVGGAVVFLVIGLVAFGVYYFLVAEPAAEELAASRLVVLDRINSLMSLGTEAAVRKALDCSSRLQGANSVAEVQAILVEVNAGIRVEQLRRELLDLVAAAAEGSYYSADGGDGRMAAPELAEFRETMLAEVNARTTLAELEACRAEINERATVIWRNLHTGELGKLGDNVAMLNGGANSGGYLAKEEARRYIAGLGWEGLRELKFEGYGTVEVPVLDTFQRTPTLTAGTRVNIYVYDLVTGVMENLWSNAVVRAVVYSQTDVARIAWVLSERENMDSYSTDIWETIKALSAGGEGAENVDWEGYGAEVVRRGLEANLGHYPLQVIYVVEVPDEIGRLIAEYEFQETSIKDVILVARV